MCLFAVGIRILYEESRDGKREMAAEISLPVTLTSTFFLHWVSCKDPPQKRCVQELQKPVAKETTTLVKTLGTLTQ